MAIRLSGAELSKIKAGDFGQYVEGREPMPVEKKGKGNPNGRPPSLTPRTSTMTLRLTDAARERLEEAARILDTTKTRIITDGIDLVYLRAKKEERNKDKEVSA